MTENVYLRYVMHKIRSKWLFLSLIWRKGPIFVKFQTEIQRYLQKLSFSDGTESTPSFKMKCLIGSYWYFSGLNT